MLPFSRVVSLALTEGSPREAKAKRKEPQNFFTFTLYIFRSKVRTTIVKRGIWCLTVYPQMLTTLLR